jgi:surface antigen
MARQNWRLPTAGLIGLLVLAGLPAQAGNLGFLNQAPVSHFNDEDMRLLKEAVSQAMQDENSHAKKTWANADTGNSGEIESWGAFKTAAGVACKRVRVTSHAKGGIDGKGTYTVCQDAERGWVVDPTAKPAADSQAGAKT